MRKHRLKTLAQYFDLSKRRLKPYEVRENDRLYQRGDIVELYNIKKDNYNNTVIRTVGGTWAPWPLDSFTKQPLSLDMFETDFLHSLECITCRISFVLPGKESFGMFDDYVILSLEVDNYRGSDWPNGRVPDLFTTAPGYNADFANNPANQIKPAVEPELEAIPEGVYYSKIRNNFYSVEDNMGMGIEFWNKWKHRKDEFPVIVEERQNKPKGKVTEETKLLRDATTAPEKASGDAKRYKPKGFA